MKKIILILMILALALAACGQQSIQENNDVQVQQSVEDEEPEESAPAPEPEMEEEMEPQIDTEVQALIDKAEEKITSFSFVYVGPPENLPRDAYHVKGDKIVVELAQATDFKISQPFTHVYLDASDKSAVAYCNVRDNVRCPDGTVNHGSVDYDEYHVRTPYQWLNQLESATYEGNGPQYEKKSTARVAFTTKGGESGIMFVLEFTGLPGKIELDDGSAIEFRDLATNSVSDEEVNPPEV